MKRRRRILSRRDVLPHVPISAPRGTNNLGRAEARPSEMVELNPREIEVHIEELVLHGFDPRARWAIGDGLENELRGLLSARGLPTAWQNNPAKFDAGAVRLTNPSATGKEIAAAIHKGGAR